MGMDLSRLEDGEKWTCSNTLWGYILESAEKGGWKPEGTSKYDEESDSEDPNWDESDYSTQEGQQVSDDDSKNMAEVFLNGFDMMMVANFTTLVLKFIKF